MEWVHRADDWLTRVIDAVKDGEDGEQQWPWHKCKSWCQFFTVCRPPQPDLTVPIPEGDLADLVRLGYQARTERKNWEKIEDAVIKDLKGLTGRVGDIQVITTSVNGAQRSYQRVEFREISS
jgi:hypothetical protein